MAGLYGTKYGPGYKPQSLRGSATAPSHLGPPSSTIHQETWEESHPSMLWVTGTPTSILSGPCRSLRTISLSHPQIKSRTCPSRKPRMTVLCAPKAALPTSVTAGGPEEDLFLQSNVFNTFPSQPWLPSNLSRNLVGVLSENWQKPHLSMHLVKGWLSGDPVGTFALVLALLTKILEAALPVQRLDRVYAHPSLW